MRAFFALFFVQKKTPHLNDEALAGFTLGFGEENVLSAGAGPQDARRGGRGRARRFVIAAIIARAVGCYLDIKGSEASSVAIAKEAYASPLSGKAFLGTYMGCREGNSYYKMSITAEGLSWEGDSTLNAVTITSENAVTGISILASKISSTDITITTDGAHAFVVKGTDYYFLSKNCTTYSSNAIAGQEAKTALATLTSGVIIDSVAKTADSTREYVLVKDGVVYLNVTIEFTTGADITDSACAFTAKASDGTTIGTYTGNSSKLTEA